MSGFWTGLRYPWRALDFVFHHPRVVKFILIPFLINLVIFAGGFYFFYVKMQDFLAIIPKSDAWYFGVLYYLAIAVIVVSYLLVAFYLFTIVGNIIAAPFNGVLSEKVEELERSNPLNLPLNLKTIFRDARRAVMTEIKKILLFLVFFVPIFIVNFIPVFGSVLYSILIFLYTAFALTFTFTDYVLERKLMSFRQKWGILLRHKGLSLGFGGMCFALGLIPLVNLFIIPICVTGGTLLYLREMEKRT